MHLETGMLIFMTLLLQLASRDFLSRQGHVVFLAVFEDDILIACANNKILRQVKQEFHSRFEMTDLGLAQKSFSVFESFRRMLASLWTSLIILISYLISIPRVFYPVVTIQICL